VLGAPAGPVHAATLEPIGPYSSPMYVTSDPSDPDRLFVVERGGTVKLTTPEGTSTFLTVPQPVAQDGEHGLFSIAFPGDFATTRLFYVAYGRDELPGYSLVLDEYRATGDAADPGSRREVLAITGAGTHHNGGQLQFGPDGYLYWSVGDAGSPANAQDDSTLFGKVLRIDPRGAGHGDYTIPGDNPFVGTPGARGEIWSLGLRNPWRFSFDRLTRALVIGDVGQMQREEVDYLTQPDAGKGANFGWPACEGTLDPGCADHPTFTEPVFEYSHADGCAITGGYVVRDSGLGDLFGRYLFADYCDDDLRSIDPLSPPAIGDFRGEGATLGEPISFGEDSCGRLYLVSRIPAPGLVSRLVGPPATDCPSSPATDTTPPNTKVELKPRSKRRHRVRAKFSSSEPGSDFECRLDKHRWKPCVSPRRLRGLNTGRHVFSVRATDRAGNVDPTPAKDRVRVKPRRD
jgi:glucose/arabinose dehydrogenase